jgi:hypothetical protein
MRQKVLKAYMEVYRYETVEEMAAHVAEMEARGYTTQFSGEVFILDSSKVADYINRKNWALQAEFYRELDPPKGGMPE